MTDRRRRTAVAREVAAVLEFLGDPAARVAPITSDAPWSPSPRTFRITTSRGVELKARICPTTARAVRAAALTARLSSPHVVIPLARVGRVMLEPWVPGVPLTVEEPPDRHLRAAGRLLRRIHEWPGLDGERLPGSRSAAAVGESLRRRLPELVGAHVLDPRVARRLAEIVGRGLPAVAPWGLMHGDLCGANLVVDRHDDLISIDNEHFRRGFLELDLARSWYRWRLPDDARHSFEAAYGAPVADGEGRRDAWRAVAAVAALHLRHRRRASLERPWRAIDDLMVRRTSY